MKNRVIQKQTSMIASMFLLVVLAAGCTADFDDAGIPTDQKNPQTTPIPVEESSEPKGLAERPVMTEEEINRKLSKLPDDGIYYGSADGRWGEISVAVTVENGMITQISIDQYETKGLGADACDEISKRIIESQSTEVDTLGGATISSQATIDAVNEALGLTGK